MKRVSTLIAASLTVLVVGVASGAPAARPWGTIVFASERSGNLELYSAWADGSRLGQLTHYRGADTGPVFSPDGSRIAFLRGREDYSLDLWLMNADGSGAHKLARLGSSPSWSPDSRRLAYMRSNGSRNPIVIASVDGGRPVVIRGDNSAPSWSPDGTRLAFWRLSGEGERTDLVVTDSYGHGLRTARRHVILGGGPLKWSPRGQIAFATFKGTYVVWPNGRGFHRVVRGGVEGFAWSPDGSRLAFVDTKGRLRVSSASGHGARNMAPRGTGEINSPAWSPDSRWLVVRRLPNGATNHEILVLAPDGTSVRRIAERIPRPWGSDAVYPTWRPRGATSARLGSRPSRALPSERVTPSSFRAAAHGSIRELAADGRRLAILTGYREHCSSIEVWSVKRRRVVRYKRPCEEEESIRSGTFGVALAGKRVAWLSTGGGNTLETILESATPANRKPVWVAFEAAYCDGGCGDYAELPFGDGRLLAFTIDEVCSEDEEGYACPPGRQSGDVVSSTVWRVGGTGRCPEERPPGSGCTRVADAEGELRVLAVNAGRIVARTDTGTRLMTKDGALLRDFPTRATVASLSGHRLALRTARAIEVYHTHSGQLVTRIAAKRGVRLEDLERDILVTAAGRKVTLRSLATGRTSTIRAKRTAHAQLERAGLYVGAGSFVKFTPMAKVLRRLR